MKALNNKEVMRSHIKFAFYMVALVAVSQLCVFSFMKVSSAEVSAIKERTGDSEEIYAAQIAISEDFSDIFGLYRTFDLSENVNPDFLMHSIVTKKMNVSNRVQTLGERDAVLYRHLLLKMDDFLRVRDSISALKKVEATAKEDLIRCNEESRNITRRVRVGRLSYGKNK